MKFGYKASAEQFAPRELLEYGVLAEELGFDSVVISDHFQPWRHTGGHSPFSFAWLGALGERTERVLLGTSVVAPAYRYHPGIVAQAMATLACLYPGRVFLGAGTGEAMNEVPLGVPWPEQKVRFQMFKEACLLMKRLWTEERVDFDGTYFKTSGATVYDRPPEGVPLYIAASGPAAARLAGRIADGFITTSGKAFELYNEKLLPAVREGIEKEGRSADEVELTLEVKVSFDDDAERAREDTHFWGALALTPVE
jgi:coenzyme F420-dependent glucose-6-phosphate dehydrogenase